MSRSLRYHQEKVQDHLASQYVLGTLTIRCRRRTERLRQQIPALEARIYQWQQRMSPISNVVPEATPPKRVWQALAKDMKLGRNTSPTLFSRLWNAVSLWRLATGISFIMLAALVFMLQSKPSTDLGSASYIASLQSVMADGALTSGEPKMVVMAYKGNKSHPSTAFLQWNQRATKTSLDGLYVWASSRQDGSLTLVGSLADMKQGLALTKSEWIAITNSAELLIFEGKSTKGEVRYRGPCLQLKAWGV